ncbi:hypothetical protein A1O3_01404 [Capronia epimyces CBS 606.96]|uniref:Cytochrome P450 oxidoreductase n=1 Tax=Capronia epimyces CBS 606.96 TaxID=1182542 RepID=W9YT79_9EURO|nr:uncharacterized protein A1O3_01404 [Capronia epimyces CBS 606.96]EXJ92850.1 hypothetical protein A1O3_01404 [Capronia epimyces CBS 606.96]
MTNNWKTYAKKICEHDSGIYLELWRDMNKKVSSGKIKPCFGKDFIESNPEKLNMNELEAAFHTGHLIEAGAETTSAALNSLLLALSLFPEASKTAQEELDRVVGPDRPPKFDDQDNLPYIKALVKEGLRWRPPNQYGMHHAVVEDDWYEGMFIPKGSVVMLNWWAIHFNPGVWESPDDFRPERYLDHPLSAATYLNVANPADRDHFAYGAGRRVCPGIHVAERSIFINVARILWAFNISKKTINGKTVEPETLCVPGWLSVPQKFECSITPRSEKHAEVIRKEYEVTDKDI